MSGALTLWQFLAFHGGAAVLVAGLKLLQRRIDAQRWSGYVLDDVHANPDPWVPVDVALPDDELEVLLYIPDNFCLGFFVDGEWHLTDDGLPVDGVTHWSELTSPDHGGAA